MHGVSAHSECFDCHAQHGVTPPGPEVCLSCHREQRNHYRDAPTCQTCHPFASE